MKEYMHRCTLVFAALCTFFLLGCGRDAQIQAIESAITSYNGCYFELDDLRGQIQKQKSTPSGSSEEIYRLKIRIPEYTQLNVHEIHFTLPPVDYSNPDELDYKKAARNAMRASYESYASTHDCPSYLETEIEVELVRRENQWVAALSSASENSLLRLVNNEFDQILDANRDLFPQFEMISIASHKDEILSWIFDDPAFSDAVTITNIDILSDGAYRMSIAYPNLTEVYTSLGDALYESYRSPVFDSVSVQLTLNREDLDRLASMTQESAEITVRYRGGSAVPEEDGELWKLWYDARAAAEKETRLRLESRWLIKAKAAPKAGLQEGSSKGNPVILDMGKENRGLNCFVAFYRIAGSDALTGGELQLSAYVPSEKTVKLKLPTGRYRMEAHFGTKWYGTAYAFGPDDRCITPTNEITSRSDYDLEIYLNDLLNEKE